MGEYTLLARCAVPLYALVKSNPNLTAVNFPVFSVQTNQVRLDRVLLVYMYLYTYIQKSYSIIYSNIHTYIRDNLFIHTLYR